MTALIPEGLEPLAVWDPVRCHDWSHGWTESMLYRLDDWMRDNLGRHRDIYRIDFYLLDAPFAVARRYKRNGDGFKYQDAETGKIAVDAPAVVPLAELPPEHLLKG